MPEAFISLDHTLYDLYGFHDDEPHPTIIYDIKIPENGPTTVKFPFHAIFQHIHGKKRIPQHLKVLAGKSRMQLRGLMGGKLPLLMLGIGAGNEQDPKAGLRDQLNVLQSFVQLRPDQRPMPSFATTIDCVSWKHNDVIIERIPYDYASNLPHLIDPELHYKLLSKPGLARSGLPTPPSVVVDLQLSLKQLDSPILVEQEIIRMTNQLDTYRIPFVVKLAQTLAGKGTMVILSEADRTQIKEILRIQLKPMLQQIKDINHHLDPCSLVLQDYLDGGAVCLSFFVTREGQYKFICHTEQHFDNEGGWCGGNISYAEQAKCHETYANIIASATQFLHNKGYCGPAGIDVMTDNFGDQHIIDLNARVTGSYLLGLLKGHFTRRGFMESTLMSGFFACSRAKFEQLFILELESGSIVVTGWTSDESIGLSNAGLVVGGTTILDMKARLGKIKTYLVPESELVNY